MKQHRFLLFAVTVLGAYAADSTSNIVALRFSAAVDAFAAVQQKLGATAAEAVLRVDDRRNTLVINSTHSHAAIVRAFLTGVDQPPPEVRVEATITRRLEATVGSPARVEELSRRIVLTPPEAFIIPEEHGSARIKFRVTQFSK